MQEKLPRDFFTGTISQIERDLLNSPLKQLVKSTRLALKLTLWRLFPKFAARRALKNLEKKNSHAREIKDSIRPFYLGLQEMIEVQIGNTTRPVVLLRDGASIKFEHKVEPHDEFFFGLSPLATEANVSRLKKWAFTVSLCTDNINEIHEIELPFNSRTECFAYYLGDGWVDINKSLEKFIGKTCSITINAKANGVDLALSSPQVLKRSSASEEHNILVISGESLTDLAYLRKHYDVGLLPNISKLCEEATVYPRVYSPADSTLSFAASLLSGLMPSQHAVGNYGVMPWSFENDIISDDIVLLPEVLKKMGFFTAFAGTETRFSSKSGWARGFDEYYHVFDKWSVNIPKIDWLHRLFQTLEGVNKFALLHLDYLHEPLTSFTDIDRPRFNELNILSSTKGDKTEALYFEQLKAMDRALGLFLDSLRERGVYDQTAIIITGDHGCGIHWVKHSEYSLYEERIRVPLIVKYPKWAVKTVASKPLSNSTTEIHKAIYAMLGQELPAYLGSLPQYQESSDSFAFSETIMNPNRQVKSHKIALMSHIFKYVGWHEIDWKKASIEKYLKEKLFKWDESTLSYDETVDLSLHHVVELEKYRTIARQILSQNLEFLGQHHPRTY